ATAGRPGWSACPAVVDLLPRRVALAVLREHLLGLGDPVRHRVDVTPCLVDRVVQAVEIPAPLREALPRSLQVLARGTNGLVVPAILRHPANLGCRTLRIRNVSASAAEAPPVGADYEGAAASPTCPSEVAGTGAPLI